MGEKTIPGVGAVGAANKQLAAEGLSTLPEPLTLHALRRAFASTSIATGRDAAYVRAAMGHSDASMALGLYAKVMSVGEQDRERLRALVEGQWMRAMDAKPEIGAPAGANGYSPEPSKTP